MIKKRIGIICPSEIAYRRFMPALKNSHNFEYAGVAIANSAEWNGELTDEIRNSELSKAQRFVDEYGGKIYNGYINLIKDDSVNAIYLPLPPALHFYWGKKVLESGKHLFLEKPSTTSLEKTKELITMASERELALHENYMFIYHNQIKYITEIIKSGEIGQVRLFRIAFGFPKRAKNDFRYVKSLGGGTLLDNGGYTIKLASMLLGKSAKVVCSNLIYSEDCDVDIFGTATIVNNSGLTAQLSFGMDNNYKCDLEVWGSKVNLFTNRIFTAPDKFVPKLIKKIGNEDAVEVDLPTDSTFEKSMDYFFSCIAESGIREENYKNILNQSSLIETINRG